MERQMGGSPKTSAQYLAGETSLLGTTRSPTAVARAPTTSGEIAISEIETKKNLSIFWLSQRGVVHRRESDNVNNVIKKFNLYCQSPLLT